MEAKGGGKRSRTSGSGTTAAVERKEVERKRRNAMKTLCFKLGSLVPRDHRSKEAMTQFGSLDDAAVYITKLKERLDELQRRRSSAMQLMSSLGGAAGRGVPTPSTTMTTTTSGGAGSDQSYDAEEVPPAPAPAVEVRQHDDSSLDVTLVCSSQRPFKFHEVIVVLEEEGVEIVHANYSVAGDKTFYIINCRAFSSRIGIEGSRVSERLKALSISGFDPHIQSPLSSPIQVRSGGWSELGNNNRQIIPSDEIPARNIADHDMEMIPLSSSNQFRNDVFAQASQHDSHAVQYDFETQTQNAACISRIDDVLHTSVNAEAQIPGELCAPWGPGDSSNFVSGLDGAIPSYPYHPTVPEEPAAGFSFSQDAEDDLLLGIDWLRTTGQAFPEHELQESGCSSNGTTCGIPLFLC